jgi:hypothetical protein
MKIRNIVVIATLAVLSIPAYRPENSAEIDAENAGAEDAAGRRGSQQS